MKKRNEEPRPLRNSKASLKKDILRHLRYSLGKDEATAAPEDFFPPLCLSIRDRLFEGMLETEKRHIRSGAKRVYYLSMEFLIGRSLGTNLLNLNLYEAYRKTLQEMGLDLQSLREQEWDAPLGNGGLGRLAACFLDSMATLGIAGYGYGLHYEYGLFKQEIDNGYQKEKPDLWPSKHSPWEIERPDEICLIPVYGRIEHDVDRQGKYNPMWLDWSVIVGVPYDMPIPGYGGQTVNFLRLYAARASSEFDIEIFNEGDYFRAVEQKMTAETISKILYPSDTFESGRELRLIQEYFLVACALRDITRRYLKDQKDFEAFPDHVAMQMNDTHPSLAVAELMRILVDEYEMPWDRAWEITVRSFAYTNHTLLSEALEKWPLSLLERVLPRHVQIIYEINRRLLDEVYARWPDDVERLSRISLIEEGKERKIRMANLAIAGSHAVNGVSALHSELIKNVLVPDFFSLWPDRFSNKTNGITQRRWLLKTNPLLSELLTKTIGDSWITRLDTLRQLENFSSDRPFQAAFRKIKKQNKEKLRQLIVKTTGVEVNPDSLFDIHAKRIHEYKRQLLKVMHIIHEYLSLVDDGRIPDVARTYIFAGKAAPGYWQAKQIIKLIHNVADIINHDDRTAGMIRVVFIPDYRVSLAEIMIPAADLSEQISTAGTEASGTGNMKFALNGALTIGTLDGANIEIREEVGVENIYIFGLTTDEVQRFRCSGSYQPWTYYQENGDIRRVMDAFWSDRFCPREPGLFRWIFDSILHKGDTYFHLADFQDYLSAQHHASRDYLDQGLWTEKAILNVARMGKFSSDRTISEYAREIWGIQDIM